MDKLKYIKIENDDGTLSENVPIGVESNNVEVGNENLTTKLNKLDANDTNHTNAISVLNSQLQTSITNLQSEISSLASGSPAGVYATVAELTSADPDHDKIYVVTTNGHWYYYNSGWQDGGAYQTSLLEIPYGTINPKQTTFMILHTNSIFDKYDIIEGGYYNSQGKWVVNASVCSSNKIVVSSTDTLKTNNTGYTTYWDSNDNFISGQIATNLTIPNNTAYLRTAFYKTSLNKIYICPVNENYYYYYTLDNDTKVTYKNLSDIRIDYQDVQFFNKKWSNNSNRLLGTVMTENASINNKGEIISGTYDVTDYTYVNPGEELAINNGGAYVAFFDREKQWIQNKSNLPTTGPRFEFTVPDNAYYLRAVYASQYLPPVLCLQTLEFSQAEESNLYIEIESTLLNTLKNIFVTEEEDSLKNLKINCLGDSITYGDNNSGISWANLLNNKINIVRKYGVSATTIAKQQNKTNSFLERYSSMNNDADIIIVMGGTNDFALNIPLGTLNSSDEYTFYGAVKSLILGLINKYPNSKIIFITELDRTYMTNGISVQYTSYLEALKETCRWYSIPVLDLNKQLGFTAKIEDHATRYIPDHLHPNTAGHQIIANKIWKFLRYEL